MKEQRRNSATTQEGWEIRASLYVARSDGGMQVIRCGVMVAGKYDDVVCWGLCSVLAEASCFPISGPWKADGLRRG